MLETDEARILLMLRDLQTEVQQMRAEMARCCSAMEMQLSEARERIDALSAASKP